MTTVQESSSLNTTNATATTIGSTFALPANSVNVVDAQIECLLADASKSKVFNVRRTFLNTAGTMTDFTQANLTGPDEVGGALGVSVAITRTGTTGRIDVTGIAATNMRWLCDRQVVQSLAAFDPATLTLTGWWRASFSASPWVGSTSLGTSSSHNLSEATNPPSAGTAVNALVPADFDGTNDKLANASGVITDFVSDAAGSIAVLFYADTAFTDPGASAYYSNPAFFVNAGDGYISLGFTTSGVRFGSFDTTSGTFNSVAAACATGAWHLAQARWNSTTMEVRVDGGVWQTLTKKVSVSSSANGIRVGCSYTAANFFDGRILDIMCAQSRLSDGDFDNIRAYANATYAVSV